MPDVFNILIVDDDEVDRMSVQRLLQRGGLECEIHEASDVDQACAALSAQAFDCALLDHLLPDGDAFEVLERVQQRDCPHTPIVVLTGFSDHTLGLQLLQAGAQDFLMKGDITSENLLRAIRYAMERQRLHHQLVETAERLSQISDHDSLTGLHDRRGFENHLQAELAAHQGKELWTAVLRVHMRSLAIINRDHGYARGDRCLVALAERLRSVLGSLPIARLGGGEFLSLQPNSLEEEVQAQAAALRKSLQDKPLLDDMPESSRGIEVVATTLRVESGELAPFLDSLQAALKKTQVPAASKGKAAQTARWLLETLQLELAIQPVIDLQENRPVGYELLSRGPQENIEPHMLFAHGRQAGVLRQLDLRMAAICLQHSKDIARAHPVHLNLFPQTLTETPIEELVELLRQHTRFPIIDLDSRWIRPQGPFFLRVAALRRRGVPFAVDHLGYGQTTLQSFLRIKPQVIKTDARLIRGLAANADKNAVLSGLVQIAKALETRLVAVGVETREDLQAVKTLGIRYAQGFLFARPGKVALPSPEA